MSYRYFDISDFLTWLEFEVLPQVRKRAPASVRRVLENDLEYTNSKEVIEHYTRKAIQEEISRYLHENQLHFILVDNGEVNLKIDGKNAWDVIQSLYDSFLEEVWLL